MPKLFFICGPGVKCRTFSIERWAISPIPIRHCLHIYIYLYICIICTCVCVKWVWTGLALALPFTFEAPRVQHLCPDCAIKLLFVGRKRGRGARHCKLLVCVWLPRRRPQLRHIRCAFHFVYLCSCRDAVFEKVPTHLQRICILLRVAKDLNLLSSWCQMALQLKASR